MGEPVSEVKLFGKWALDEIEVSDLALAVNNIKLFPYMANSKIICV